MLDIIVLAVILFFVWFGVKSGAAKSLLRMFSSLIAFFISSIISPYFANAIYNVFVKESMTEHIADTLSNNPVSENAAQKLTAVLSNMPGFMFNFCNNFSTEDGVSVKASLIDTINQAPANTAPFIETAIAPIVIGLIGIIVMILIFPLCFIILRRVSKLAEAIFSVPVLNQINRTAGGILGLISACVFILFAAVVLKTIIPLLSDVPAVFSYESIQKTFIFKYFYYPNIFYSDYL